MPDDFVWVRIPETGALWNCHPMTAEAHDLAPLEGAELAEALGLPAPLPVAETEDEPDLDDPKTSEPVAPQRNPATE